MKTSLFQIKKARPILLLALSAWLGAGSLWAAEIIGFKIESPKNSNQNYMFAGDWAGAPAVRTNNWNNLQSTIDGSTTLAITMADGMISNSAGNVVSGMSVIFQPNYAGGGIYNRTSGGTNDGKMFADVADTYGCSGFTQYGYFDITNIPYATYQIYCYFRPDNGSGSVNTRGGFWLITNTPTGSQRYYIQNQSNDVAQTQEPVPSNAGVNYVQSTTTSIPSGGAAWSSIQGGNYAVFSGLTNSATRIWFGGLGNGSGGKDDLGNYVNGGATAVRFKVCAFQIVKTPTGTATSLFFGASNQVLHAGNPAGVQLTVVANLDTGATGVDETAGSAFSSDNTNVVAVSSTGLIKPGTNGTAHVIATFQTKSVTNLVTVIGPTSLTISVARTNLLYGNGQGDTTTTTLYANYTDASNVPVNSYQFVNFSATGGILTATTNGTLTAIGTGAFSVTGAYDGLSVTTNNVGVVSAFAAPGTVAALSVDIADSTAHGMTFHDLSGAPGARVGYWNNLVVPSSGNVTNQIVPTDYHGNILGDTLVQWIPGAPSGSYYAYSAGTLTTNESVMFGSLFDQGMNNGTSYTSLLVVSNVPFTSYDVYVYFYNDTGATTRPAQVTIDGVTQYRINSASYSAMPANDGSGYVQAAQPASTPTSVTQVPFGNYIKFAGITDNVLNINWGAVGQDVFGDAASVTRARIVGFQLVKSLDGLQATNIYLQSVVPAQLPGNPATFALTLLADFTDGELGGNITALSGVTYASSDNNVFQVNANGVITPGLTPGVATLTVTYQTNTLTANVTNLTPTAVRVVAKPGTVYLDGSLGITTAQAGLYADFSGHANVNISGFNSVSFVDQGSSVATMDTAGSITASSQGQANLGASYIGATWVSTNAFTVSSIANPPVLKHLYNFTNTTQVIDSIGGANGTVYPPTDTNKPITLDGARAIFPGDGTYANAPYISLPAGLINQMGDVTIEIWCGQSQLEAWSRIASFGSTAKGTDPHNYGAEISILELLASYVGTGHATFFTPSHGADAQAGFALTNNAEYHMVMVYAPNAGTADFYINGALIGSGSPVVAPLSTSVNDTVDWLGVSLANNDPPFAGWINELAIYEGALSATQVAANYNAGKSVFLPPISTVPTNIVSSVTGNALTLSWPADHLGWKLQVQTNALNNGLGGNWVDVPGSTSTTSAVITINPTNSAVFYRLMYQP